MGAFDDYLDLVRTREEIPVTSPFFLTPGGDAEVQWSCIAHCCRESQSPVRKIFPQSGCAG